MSGSGTNSGINYQQRIAAFTIVAQIADFDLSLVFGISQKLEIKTIHFETSDPIDDLKIKCKNCTLYLQIKRTLSLQVDDGTEFNKVIKQFVNQYSLGRLTNECYILVTSISSSNTIIHDLSKITESIRLNDESFRENPLNKSEKISLEKFRTLFLKIFEKENKKTATEQVFIDFTKRIYISVIDIEKNRPNEQVALILLASKNFIDPILIWNSLIANSLEYARKRQSVTKQAIEAILKRYVASNESLTDDNGDLEDLFLTEDIYEHGFCVSKEVLLIESIDNEFDYLIIELFRFSDESKKKHEFYTNKVKLENTTQEITLIQRASTFIGINRFLEENADKFKGKKIGIISSNPEYNIEEDEKRPIAELHRKYLKQLEAKNKYKFRCIHCDKALNINNSVIVEIDDLETKPAFGAVHNKCLRPIDRIIGKYDSILKNNKKMSLNFDYLTWANLLIRGQGLMNGLRKSKNFQDSLQIVAWSANEKEFRDFSYCIRVTLENDSTVYVNDRGRIHRLNKPEAKETRKQMKDSIRLSRENGDQMCYTDKTFTFGNKSLLLAIKNNNEKILEIKEVEVIKYSKLLEKYDYNIFFYAPLCLLRHSEEETLFHLNTIVPLISDPLDFNKYRISWKKSGFNLNMDEIEFKIIKSDLEFDSYMREFFSTGMAPIIDPIFDENFNLTSGIDVRHREQLLATQKETRIPVNNPKWLKGDNVKLLIPTIADNNYPIGIIIENEFKGIDNQLYVIFRPIENGIELDLSYVVPSTLLEKNE
jgi:hypothetical protein